MKKIAIFISGILLCVTPAFAQRIDTLLGIASSQERIANEAKEETGNFENVKKGIEDGRIRKGMSKDSIMKQYGAPVIELEKAKSSKEKWVYKPAASSFFDGEKIYLIFDDNGILEEAKIVGKK